MEYEETLEKSFNTGKCLVNTYIFFILVSLLHVMNIHGTYCTNTVEKIAF